MAALAVGVGETIGAAVGGALVPGLRLAAIRYRLRMPEFRSPP
ncbi:MAG: hypothetical protein Q8O52_16790 [Sulfuritalea sp.]|nr:hypothetical protein [Sulfuritalea sp.]